MKFKTYLKSLNEAPAYFRGIDYLMSMSYIPITTKVQKLLGYDVKVKDVYHATSIDFLDGLKNIQNSKNHISTFTHNLSNLIDKITTKPDILVKLNGTVNMDFDFDIFSHPDKFGRRWLSTRGSSKSDFLKHAINDKVIKEIIKLSGKDLKPDDLFFDDYIYQKTFNELQKKDKTFLVQMYFDRVHEILKNNIYTKILKEILSSPDGREKTKYNELIVNKFKILGVYSIEANKYKFNHEAAKDDIEQYGLKYLGHLDLDKIKII